jgi:RecB family exonuclease
MADRAPTPRNQFSFSRLKTFHQCPLRYRYRYIEGRREAFRSIETYLGSTLHAVLEWLYDRRDRAESPTLAAALEELARRWSEGWTEDVAVVRVGETADGAFRDGREMLSLFHRSTFARDRSETVALEQRFSEPLSDDMYFSGVADRIGRTDGGRLFVVDYKTSRSPGTPEEFSEGLQAQLYAGCALRRHDESEALAGYHYLRLGSTSWHLVSRSRAEQLLGRFAELAHAAATPPSFRPAGSCARGPVSTPSVRRRECRSSCRRSRPRPPQGPSPFLG